MKRKSRAIKLQRRRTDDHKVASGGIPMKCRKFPKSFWQPPNRPNRNIYENKMDKNEMLHTRTGHIKITSAPDTNLLFSLFKHLKQNSGHTVASSIRDPTETTISEVDKKTITEDEESFKELTCSDDPYMSKEDCRGLKKSLKSSKNYSELLSDLVVNL